MKYQSAFFKFVTVVITLTLAITFLPQSEVHSDLPVVWVSPASGTLYACDGYIYVKVNDVANLYAYDILLQFTSSIPGAFEIVEVTNGGFLENPYWVIPLVIDNTNLRVRAQVTQTYPTPAKNGDGDLLRIRIRTLIPGATVGVHIINVDDVPAPALPTKLSAYGGIPIEFTTVDGSFTTSDECPFTPHVFVNPRDTCITQVGTFTLTVDVRYAVDLVGYSLKLAFDPGSIFVTSVTNGSFLQQGLVEPTNSINNTTGTISHGVTWSNPSVPQTGSGTLITISGFVLDFDPSIVEFNILDTSRLVYWYYNPEIPNDPGSPAFLDFTHHDGVLFLGSCPPTAVTSVSLTTDSLKEQMPVGTEIGTLVAEGLHPSEFYTYTLVDRLNYPDNNAFTISGNKLLSAEVFNASVKNTYTIKVNAFMDIEPRDESIDEVLTVSIKPAQTFSDVPVPEWSWQYIENIFARGITTGCALNPLRYCPDRAVTRGEMAVFILRALNVDALAYYAPGEGAANPFVDVPAAGKLWMEPWIAQFYKDELTTGCAVNPMRYCPERSVTRAEMAVFLLRARGIALVDDGINPFVDVPVPGKEWMEPWIVTFYNEGYTTGCGTSGDKLMYCPERSVTRAEMAAFLDRVFLEEPAP